MLAFSACMMLPAAMDAGQRFAPTRYMQECAGNSETLLASSKKWLFRCSVKVCASAQHLKGA